MCNYCQKSNLQYLNLCGCEEIEEYAFFCLLKFTSLTYLNLKHTKLSANFEQIIVKHLSHLTKVEFLNYSPQMDFNVILFVQQKLIIFLKLELQFR